MNRVFVIAVVAGMVMVGGAGMAVPQKPVLWYDKPAEKWDCDALPLGNGRLGCMVFGGNPVEHIQFNVDSLWTGDENPSGAYDPMGAYQNFGDLFIASAGYKRNEVSCPSGHKAFTQSEEVAASVDGDAGTKWCVEHHNCPVQWQMRLAKPLVVTGYTLVAGNDVPARDPQDWVLEGSNDGQDWAVLDRRSGEDQLPGRCKGRHYGFDNGQEYGYYRFSFTKNHGEARYQLSEIQLDGVNIAKKRRGGKPGGYRRELNLETGIHRVMLRQGDIDFTREMFCSRPAGVIVMRLSGDKPGQCGGVVSLKDAHGKETVADGGMLLFEGGLKNGLRYAAAVGIRTQGGTLKADGEKLVFAGCDSVVLVLGAATDYVMSTPPGLSGADVAAKARRQCRAALAQSYDELRQRSVAEHSKVFNRVKINLGEPREEQAALPIDKRIAAVKQGGTDVGLENLLFQYGRYLLMGSSAPGTLPANLQGIWNNSNNPAWHCDYHSNINLQMNYWGAEPGNLSEYHIPLFDLLNASKPVFRKCSQKAFGGRGFTIRTSHNPFGGMGWQWDMTSSAWYGRHFWDHYCFTGDKTFLSETAYPWLKEVSEFWLDQLVKNAEGKWVVHNGWSPEHGPKEDGVSYSQEIVWDLFSNTIKASEVLDTDADFRKRLADVRDDLLWPKIGSWGQLQEWAEDRDDPNDHHRHTSHLYAVYPGDQITLSGTPELAKAAAVSLAARGTTGDSRRSWTWPWRCALWARLGEPEKAHDMVVGMIRYNLLNNMIATHPPLQLDGNFGITGGMSEILLQSHEGDIHLLPALPEGWDGGYVVGLRARGGYTVSMSWKDGRLERAIIRADFAGKRKVRYNGRTKNVLFSKGRDVEVRF